MDNIIFMPREFLSTLSLRRATLKIGKNLTDRKNFYPRSPCGERPVMYNIVFVTGKFLSTLSLRRATIRHNKLKPRQTNFYPRSPCGERRCQLIVRSFIRRISIHALLAESDPAELTTLVNKLFISIHALLAESDEEVEKLSRVTVISIHALLAESDHVRCFSPAGCWRISIHALLAESDVVSVQIGGDVRHFYPRSPCGERRPFLPLCS